MKTSFYFPLLALACLLAFGACGDDIESPHMLPPEPDKVLFMEPYENLLPADSSELSVNVYLAVNDTGNISIDEIERVVNWQIKSVGLYDSGDLETYKEVIDVTDPVDTVRGEWFTLIREEGGNQLRCVVSPNFGEKRAVFVETTGVYETHYAGCWFIQEAR